MQMTSIKKGDQENVLHCFWIMMSELDSVVDNGGCKDVVLKKQVEGFYKLWNKITGSNNQPSWERRAKAEPVATTSADEQDARWRTITCDADHVSHGNPKSTGDYLVQCVVTGDFAASHYDAHRGVWQNHSGEEICFGERTGDRWLSNTHEA